MNIKDIDKIIVELSGYITSRATNEIRIRFVGGSAVCLYGGGTTMDVDFDFYSDDPINTARMLDEFFRKKNIPVDFSEDSTGWWMVHVKKNRYTPTFYKKIKNIIFETAHPLEIIIKKLHRYYSKDIEDALFLFEHFNITDNQLLEAIKCAIKDSPVSEQLFMFKRNIENFVHSYSLKLWQTKPESLLEKLNKLWEEAIKEKNKKLKKEF